MASVIATKNGFEKASTDPISRSASPFSADAVKSRYAELLAKLETAYEEAKEEYGRDNDIVTPVEAPFAQAKSFILSLSSHPFVLPMIMFLDDGGICFQWTTEQKGILTATLYADNVLVYVARFGPKERSTGTDEFRNDALSESLLVWLKKYFTPRSKQLWMSTPAIMNH